MYRPLHEIEMRIINFPPGSREEEERHLITTENMRLEFHVKHFQHFHYSNGYFLDKTLMCVT